MTGCTGDGVLGPTEDAAVVYDGVYAEPFKMEEGPMEPTRGDEVPEEYACCGGGSGSEGNLSFTYEGR
jgi:hypothetical protein